MKMSYPGDYIPNNPSILGVIEKDFSEFPLGAGKHYLFVGCCGSGKTLLAKAVLNSIRKACKNVIKEKEALPARLIQAREVLRSTEFVAARTLYRDYMANSYQLPELKPYCVLDDLGAEAQTQGARQLMADVICGRYDAWQAGESPVFIITTNLSFNEINNRYGERAAGRLLEMCVVMRFAETDFRKQQTTIIKGGDNA